MNNSHVRMIPDTGLMAKDVRAHLHENGEWIPMTTGLRHEPTLIYTLCVALTNGHGDPIRAENGTIACEVTDGFVSLQAMNTIDLWRTMPEHYAVVPVNHDYGQPTTRIDCELTGAVIVPASHVVAIGQYGTVDYFDHEETYDCADDAFVGAMETIDRLEGDEDTMDFARMIVHGRRWPTSNTLKYEATVDVSGNDGHLRLDNTLDHEVKRVDELTFREAMERQYAWISPPQVDSLKMSIHVRTPGQKGISRTIEVFEYEG